VLGRALSNWCSMAYRLPAFNLSCGIYRFPNAFPGIPDFVLDGQLYFYSRASWSTMPGFSGIEIPGWLIRFPPRVDVRVGDTIECEIGSAKIYNVEYVDDCHRGFVNEYRVAIVNLASFPVPMV
jgi:hypothetical protein